MEAMLYDKLDNGRVRCGICSHLCMIRPGERGLCSVRENRDGKLVSLVYPKLVAAGIDPIEKKPIFHFKPGSKAYSIATAGCNFKCDFCQNADIAQMDLADTRYIPGRHMNPQDIVDQAVEAGCESIAYTYTEPTVFFEVAFETARIAGSKGIGNVFVTNGYMSPKALEKILPFMDAANVDLKAFNDAFYRRYCGARLAPVTQTIETMKQAGVLVEVTTLLIPGLNDDPGELSDLAGYLAGTVGKDTPWHISRFHPCHRMTDRPVTPLSSMKTAWEAGKNAGLHYIYLGNVPGSGYENTLCHSCGALLIERHGYRIRSFFKQAPACPSCGTPCAGRY